MSGTQPTRRSFLAQSTLAAAALASGFGPLTSPLRAGEPIQRPGTPKFKFSLAAYSYRGLLSGANPQLTLEDFLADCAKFQLDAAELTSYYFPKEPSGEYLRQLKHTAFRLGLDISGTAVGNDFCLPPGPKRDEQLGLVKRWIDYAEIFGAPVIRVFSGKAQSGQSEEEATRLAIAGLEECCQYAGEHGVFLALENHGGLTTKTDDLVRIVQAVQSPWIGINLDTGNMHGSADEEAAYADMAKMAPYALNVQIKVEILLAGRKSVMGDFAREAQILRDSGYRGYIVLEYEEAGDVREECPKYLEKLREAFA